MNSNYNRPRQTGGLADPIYPYPHIFLARGEGNILVAILRPLFGGKHASWKDGAVVRTYTSYQRHG
jgi:hypothetical protein